MTPSILVVDDSLTVRMDLVEAFRAAEFQATPCETGQQAREALTRQAFDLVVLDLVLPDLDGIDLLREIRSGAFGCSPFVMLLSSEAEVGSRIRGLLTGADEFVGKPYDTGYLIARAGELLHDRTAGSQDSSGSRPTVLLIDDSPTFRDTMRQAVEGAGFQALMAETGEEGLRIAAARRPTAIIVDGVLPGIDGPTVIRHLRLDAALRRIPCVLLTASQDGAAEVQALDAGADAFVRKEEDVQVILARLQAVLRSAGHSIEETSTTSLQSPKRILAVDDSETYLQTVAEALRAEGYEPILARSGEEALDLLAIQPTDCVLLDLSMPGLGGKETCRRIKAAPGIRDIPVIMLTAVEDREAMLEGLGAGADDYVPKSSDLRILKARMQAQIRRRQFEDENRAVRGKLQRAEIEAREARAAAELAKVRESLLRDLELKNEELEAFSYSVSHDLRAPLRGIDGFSLALLEEYRDKLDPRAQDYLARVRLAAQRMGMLIDDLLDLSRVGRTELRRIPVDVTALAREVASGLTSAPEALQIPFEIADGMSADCDPRLLRVVFENLLGNACKFSSKVADPRIQVGLMSGGVYFVRDNGSGFDMAFAKKLFAPFQRLHSAEEFEGTGIGLATVKRIVERHGGQIWAEAMPGTGATFYWTLSKDAATGRASP
jgi:two-component system, NtrC family, sensor kinase